MFRCLFYHCARGSSPWQTVVAIWLAFFALNHAWRINRVKGVSFQSLWRVILLLLCWPSALGCYAVCWFKWQACKSQEINAHFFFPSCCSLQIGPVSDCFWTDQPINASVFLLTSIIFSVMSHVPKPLSTQNSNWHHQEPSGQQFYQTGTVKNMENCNKT